MKWIIAAVLIVGSMFLYGVIEAKSQLSNGVSLMQVALTYNSMNPISRYGYQLVITNDPGLRHSVYEMNKSFDALKADN